MKRIAILLENYYDDKELLYPYFRMQEAGFDVDLIGSKAGETYKSKNGLPSTSDKASSEVNAKDYDALIIPGGFSPDYMRRNADTIAFTNAINAQNKPIAAICHGAWLLISSIDLSRRTMTGFHTLKVDLENAGATFVDQAVVTDGNIITSRTPKDLPVFAQAIIKALK